ncbi:hypothetical protein RRF57_005852 [Xylaria bambusicola]|uniref:Uncharacterized protein n=1 Tax=Xylaria bambusicola TaxID=326684 RepID=A0AAN7Z548_9PEZI
MRLVRTCLRNGLNNLFECIVEGERVVEGVEEQAFCQLGVVVANMIEINDEPLLVLLEHEDNVGSVTLRMLVICSERSKRQ